MKLGHYARTTRGSMVTGKRRRTGQYSLRTRLTMIPERLFQPVLIVVFHVALAGVLYLLLHSLLVVIGMLLAIGLSLTGEYYGPPKSWLVRRSKGKHRHPNTSRKPTLPYTWCHQHGH